MILDIAICIIVFLIGINLPNYFRDLNSNDKKRLRLLFFYHMAIAVIFHFYVSANGGDAIGYWESPRSMSITEIVSKIENGSASTVIVLINYLPSNVLNLSFLTGNMVYALFGYIGFVFLYRILLSLFSNLAILKGIKLFRVPLFPWILFLPNFHFWSSGIGKDTILFTCIILFLYAFQNIKKRVAYILFSSVLMLAIRPHMLLFLLLAFAIGYIFDGSLKGYQKVFLSLFLITGFVVIFPYVMSFVKLESLDVSNVESYVTQKAAGLNQDDSGSGIDTSSYSFPLKVFTFLYRPLFIDSPSILGLVSSIENLILILFTVKIALNKPLLRIRNSNYFIKSLAIYFLITTSAFALILGNLGIMLRQKNMVILALVLLGYWILYANSKPHENTTRN